MDAAQLEMPPGFANPALPVTHGSANVPIVCTEGRQIICVASWDLFRGTQRVTLRGKAFCTFSELGVNTTIHVRCLTGNQLIFGQWV